MSGSRFRNDDTLELYKRGSEEVLFQGSSRS